MAISNKTASGCWTAAIFSASAVVSHTACMAPATDLFCGAVGRVRIVIDDKNFELPPPDPLPTDVAGTIVDEGFATYTLILIEGVGAEFAQALRLSSYQNVVLVAILLFSFLGPLSGPSMG